VPAVTLLKGHVAADHVHLFVSIPPEVSRLVQWVKGKTSHKLMAEYAHLRKTFWGQHLWARGYFCCSSGRRRARRREQDERDGLDERVHAGLRS